MSTIPLALGIDEGMSRYAAFGGLNNCYRYTLGRRWERDGYRNAVCFVALNPSTADALVDDPTVKRMITYARAWGFGALRLVNLFALRATEPEKMMRHPEPIGSDNDDQIMEAVAESKLVVACWGGNGGHLNRDRAVMEMIGRCHCFIVTKDGFPGHPLYLPSNLVPLVYEGRPL